MTDTKCVKLTFIAFGKACQAVLLAHAVHLSGTTSQDLVWVSLVAYVPDQLVIRCVVHVVQCGC